MKQREQIQKILNINLKEEIVNYEIIETIDEVDYLRQLIKYQGSEDDEIRAYLFLPKSRIIGSVLVHHQHNGEWHLGKSEVAGIVGDSFQSFCPELAKKGIITLAPDST
ncbi:MAG: hypothetical protein ACPG4Y_10615, partial [Chitinophagales bacterium]